MPLRPLIKSPRHINVAATLRQGAGPLFGVHWSSTLSVICRMGLQKCQEVLDGAEHAWLMRGGPPAPGPGIGRRRGEMRKVFPPSLVRLRQGNPEPPNPRSELRPGGRDIHAGCRGQARPSGPLTPDHLPQDSLEGSRAHRSRGTGLDPEEMTSPVPHPLPACTSNPSSVHTWGLSTSCSIGAAMTHQLCDSGGHACPSFQTSQPWRVIPSGAEW